VVILDLVVAAGQGAKETFANLKELDAEVRAVVTTGYATDPILDEYRQFGFRSALTKPYTVHSIERALRDALEE
jgi:ActR/RegA family two-component response regulator